MMTDPLGDMLARIRNALMRGKSTVRTPASNLRRRVLNVMRDEGYIIGHENVTSEKGLPEILVHLKYFENAPAIKELRRVSTPGRRVYAGVKEMPRVRNGLGVSIVSTPRGVMSDAAAREANVGGEVLCQVF